MHSFMLWFACLGALILSGCQSPSKTESVSTLEAAGFGVSLGWKWNFGRSLGESEESGVAMGKWASAKRVGSNVMAGRVPEPPAASFSIGSVTATTIQVNRSGAYPTGVLAYQAMAVKVTAPAGGVTLSPITNGSSINITGLTTGTQYNVYVAWGDNTSRISEWTFIGLQATP